MKPKRKPNRSRLIPFRTLKQILERSGFDVAQTSETHLLANTDERNSRARSVVPQIYGLFVPDHNQILINQSLSSNEKVTTVLHELTHLANPQLNEPDTESAAQTLAADLSDSDRGYIEFLLT